LSACSNAHINYFFSSTSPLPVSDEREEEVLLLLVAKVERLLANKLINRLAAFVAAAN
jgi:hypothetical protein